jgi:peptidoglycan/LPS O-acetylase OafA/YrhL
MDDAAPVVQNKKRRHFLIALNLMRGLAALAVMLAHLRGDAFVEFAALPATQHGSLTALFFAFTRLGDEAVMVFFVLSGFLVGGQVLHRLLQRTFDLYDYGIDRATRILIPLVPACLFAAGVQSILFHEPPPIGQLIGNMVGLNELLTDTLDADGVLWTLTYEIWFYILAGALAYAASQRLNLICALCLAACVLVFATLQPNYLIFWMIGAMASLLKVNRFSGWIALLGALLSSTGALLFELAAQSKSLIPIVVVSPIVADYFICIGVSMALPFLASEAINARLIPIKNLAAGLAAFSYTLYLTHRPTDALLGRFFGKADSLSFYSMTVYGSRIAICLAVAICFYFAFERNTDKVRAMLRNQDWRTLLKRTSRT